MKSPVKEDPARRRKDLAVIHAGKKRLELDDENYRVLLEGLTGQRSAAHLTAAERGIVINKLEELGGRTAPRSASKPAGQTYASQNRVTPGPDKARLLWKIDQLLGEMDKNRDYAESILKQMMGAEAPSALDWATPTQLNKLVAALKIHQRRQGR